MKTIQPTTKLKISAVIPCLNEETTLPICIKKAQQAFADLNVLGEVIVGDNGSSDKSVEIALELGARVVHQKKRGYGAALQAALEAAEGDYIIMADADDSYDWQNLAPFVQKLEQGYDFVIGNRFLGHIHTGAMPFLHRYVGNPVLSWISRRLYNVSVGDFHCGMRGFTRKAYSKLMLQTEGMEFATEMIVQAAHSNLQIAEVPINLYPDKRTRPPHLRTFRDGWRHLRFIMTYAPNHLYLAPGGLLFLIGIALLALLATGPVTIAGFFMGTHFLALGLLCTLIGLNIISQGVIAKAYLLRQAPTPESRLTNWLKKYYSLERGLAVGGTLSCIGIAIDATLFYRWLIIKGPMEDSTHIVFVGTGLIAIGVNIIFSSFLLSMFLINNKPSQNKKQLPTTTGH